MECITSEGVCFAAASARAIGEKRLCYWYACRCAAITTVAHITATSARDK